MMIYNKFSPLKLALVASLFHSHAQAEKCPDTRLVKTQTGFEATCGDGGGVIYHYWPIDYSPGACHAWQGTGSDGRLHSNSAKNMRCEEGKFKFTQYAGNLVCSGNGVDKAAGNECEQDIPPSLYTIGVDLSCCIDPSGDACQALTGQPSARAGSSIFLDGEECKDKNSNSGETVTADVDSNGGGDVTVDRESNRGGTTTVEEESNGGTTVTMYFTYFSFSVLIVSWV